MASRKLEDLDPILQKKAIMHIAACAERGIDLLIYCTWRSPEEQAVLYEQGRYIPGDIVTWARAGESKHNATFNGLPSAKAYDCVGIHQGKAIWNRKDPSWEIIGEEGEKLGLSWAARWLEKSEFPHFELK